jgi:hypothetical protein
MWKTSGIARPRLADAKANSQNNQCRVPSRNALSGVKIHFLSAAAQS